MSKKRILYFHHAIGMGGAPRSLSFLISKLDQNEFEPIVVMPKRDGNDQVKQLFLSAGAEVVEAVDIRPFNGTNGAPCRRLKKKAYCLLAYPLTVRCARKLVGELSPALVHLNTICLPAVGKGSHQAAPSTPVIAHVRETLLTNAWGRMLAGMNRRHVDWFISIDRHGLNSVGDVQGDVIYNFVDTNEFCPNPETRAEYRKRLGWKPDETIFLSLSRVADSNGALELSQLVQECDSRLAPSARFVVAGFEEPLSSYAQQAKLGLERQPRCRAMEFTREVIQTINAADAIIAPFITAHSSRSVFEGAAIGKPAVVSNLPNLAELIEEDKTGCCFSWSDPESFINSINQICDPDRQIAMSNASRELAIARFDANRNANAIMDVYRRFLS